MHIVRKVLPTEYHKYRTHLKALDDDSKRLRFTAMVSDSFIDTLCDKIEADPEHHVLFAIENENLEFVAVGHIAVFANMELAFSVLKEHQGKGMGNLLMDRVIQYCRTHNILKGEMICLSSNSVMKHLCSKHGIIMHSEYGETTADIELPSANAMTYWSEGISSNLGFIDYMSKRTMYPWKILSNNT